MAATVKTLLEHHGELYWGTRKANPGYCYGLALDVGADGLAAELVYVMSDLDENDEPLVTPETLVSCFTVNDLEDNGIILSNYLDDEDAPEAVGWYCIEKSFFGRDNVEALLDDNARLDGYLDIVLQILLISPEEVAQGMPSLDELSFFDLLEELEGVAERIHVPPRGRRAVRLGARRRRGFPLRVDAPRACTSLKCYVRQNPGFGTPRVRFEPSEGHRACACPHRPKWGSESSSSRRFGVPKPRF